MCQKNVPLVAFSEGYVPHFVLKFCSAKGAHQGYDGLYKLKTLCFHTLDAFPGKDYEIDPSARRSENTLPKRNVTASETEQNYGNRYNLTQTL